MTAPGPQQPLDPAPPTAPLDAATALPPLDAAAAMALLDAVDAHPSVLNITRAAAQFDELSAALAAALPVTSLRLACLASFTFDPILPALRLAALRARIAIDPLLAPFGQFDQQLIDPNSPLATHIPHGLLLALRLQDLCPAIYDRFNEIGAPEARFQTHQTLGRLHRALAAFRARSPAWIILQDFDLPAANPLGIADHHDAESQSEIIRDANIRLRQLAASLPNLFIMDYDALVAAHGRLHWTDPRTELLARIPIAAEHHYTLARFYLRHIRPLCGLAKKVLVLDADDTLWGGLIGDLGPDSIAIGHDFPGNAFRAFQLCLLDLYHRGVVLCLASKNNPEPVMHALQRHPEMILRAEHFAALRINWNPKPQNLCEMAAELNLGLDSFVFIDDSPVECDLMRRALPEVLTLQAPADPARLPALAGSLDCFDQWTLTPEDRTRGKLYKAESQRRELSAAAVDLPNFYRDLAMRLTIGIDNPAHAARAAQLTARTNQFNMNTLRLTEDDIRAAVADPNQHLITLALADRFGDSGLIGLALIQISPTVQSTAGVSALEETRGAWASGPCGAVAKRPSGSTNLISSQPPSPVGTPAAAAENPAPPAPSPTPLPPHDWTLRMFLLSCRVLGRTIEQTFLTWIAHRALAAGASRLLAQFTPTKKNEPFADFYAQSGLTPLPPRGEVRLFAQNLNAAPLPIPDWFQITA